MNTLPVNVFQIKTLADLRVVLGYVAVPILVTLAAAKGWDQAVWQQIGLAVIAAVPSSLAVFNSTDKARAWAYGLVGAVAPVMIAFGWFSNSDWQLWLPVVTLILANGAPAQNTPTSTPYGELKSAA